MAQPPMAARAAAATTPPSSVPGAAPPSPEVLDAAADRHGLGTHELMALFEGDAVPSLPIYKKRSPAHAAYGSLPALPAKSEAASRGAGRAPLELVPSRVRATQRRHVVRSRDLEDQHVAARNALVTAFTDQCERLVADTMMGAWRRLEDNEARLEDAYRQETFLAQKTRHELEDYRAQRVELGVQRQAVLAQLASEYAQYERDFLGEMGALLHHYRRLVAPEPYTPLAAGPLRAMQDEVVGINTSVCSNRRAIAAFVTCITHAEALLVGPALDDAAARVVARWRASRLAHQKTHFAQRIQDLYHNGLDTLIDGFRAQFKGIQDDEMARLAALAATLAAPYAKPKKSFAGTPAQSDRRPATATATSEAAAAAVPAATIAAAAAAPATATATATAAAAATPSPSLSDAPLASNDNKERSTAWPVDVSEHERACAATSEAYTQTLDAFEDALARFQDQALEALAPEMAVYVQALMETGDCATEAEAQARADEDVAAGIALSKLATARKTLSPLRAQVTNLRDGAHGIVEFLRLACRSLDHVSESTALIVATLQDNITSIQDWYASNFKWAETDYYQQLEAMWEQETAGTIAKAHETCLASLKNMTTLHKNTFKLVEDACDSVTKQFQTEMDGARSKLCSVLSLVTIDEAVRTRSIYEHDVIGQEDGYPVCQASVAPPDPGWFTDQSRIAARLLDGLVPCSEPRETNGLGSPPLRRAADRNADRAAAAAAAGSVATAAVSSAPSGDRAAAADHESTTPTTNQASPATTGQVTPSANSRLRRLRERKDGDAAASTSLTPTHLAELLGFSLADWDASLLAALREAVQRAVYGTLHARRFQRAQALKVEASRLVKLYRNDLHTTLFVEERRSEDLEKAFAEKRAALGTAEEIRANEVRSLIAKMHRLKGEYGQAVQAIVAKGHKYRDVTMSELKTRLMQASGIHHLAQIKGTYEAARKDHIDDVQSTLQAALTRLRTHLQALAEAKQKNRAAWMTLTDGFTRDSLCVMETWTAEYEPALVDVQRATMLLHKEFLDEWDAHTVEVTHLTKLEAEINNVKIALQSQCAATDAQYDALKTLHTRLVRRLRTPNMGRADMMAALQQTDGLLRLKWQLYAVLASEPVTVPTLANDSDYETWYASQMERVETNAAISQAAAKGAADKAALPAKTRSSGSAVGKTLVPGVSGASGAPGAKAAEGTASRPTSSIKPAVSRNGSASTTATSRASKAAAASPAAGQPWLIQGKYRVMEWFELRVAQATRHSRLVIDEFFKEKRVLRRIEAIPNSPGAQREYVALRLSNETERAAAYVAARLADLHAVTIDVEHCVPLWIQSLFDLARADSQAMWRETMVKYAEGVAASTAMCRHWTIDVQAAGSLAILPPPLPSAAVGGGLGALDMSPPSAAVAAAATCVPDETTPAAISEALTGLSTAPPPPHVERFRARTLALKPDVKERLRDLRTRLDAIHQASTDHLNAVSRTIGHDSRVRAQNLIFEVSFIQHRSILLANALSAFPPPAGRPVDAVTGPVTIPAIPPSDWVCSTPLSPVLNPQGEPIRSYVLERASLEKSRAFLTVDSWRVFVDTWADRKRLFDVEMKALLSGTDQCRSQLRQLQAFVDAV
ncbi:hypothetical protein CXG81DRAFT_24456 [Caulochytrium protostelioides]|uniref:DUF4456 domain-containing protein n=1 Tax=Caulochytrium protostelioides TaxID=1555241 RepID=A0A4P9XBS8_9FUNG|nr:hypothetical protein CXG81DRAFT_24456 [Caulochytrium protostelioides]|eukprot:RKP02856.1 hypothetical protein CXG81DRAFT_24456 [Caulochytrium protostelioides]